MTLSPPSTMNENCRNILVPAFSTIRIVNPKNIICIKAMQNYCMMYNIDGSHIFASISFGRAFIMLEPQGFFHCHRSYAINMRHINRYHKKGVVELVTNMEIPIARRRKEEFMSEMSRSVYTIHQ